MNHLVVSELSDFGLQYDMNGEYQVFNSKLPHIVFSKGNVLKTCEESANYET